MNLGNNISNGSEFLDSVNFQNTTHFFGVLLEQASVILNAGLLVIKRCIVNQNIGCNTAFVTLDKAIVILS